MPENRGVDFLIFVQTGGTDAAPLYTKVGGQRGGTFNRSADELDLTSKDSGGFAARDYGMADWSIDGDGVIIQGDAAYAALETAFLAKAPVMVRWNRADGTVYSGKAIITDFPEDAPYDDVATYSITLSGVGPYTKQDAPVA